MYERSVFVTNQLTKVYGCPQNYLCDFHLCTPFRSYFRLPGNERRRSHTLFSLVRITYWLGAAIYSNLDQLFNNFKIFQSGGSHDCCCRASRPFCSLIDTCTDRQLCNNTTATATCTDRQLCNNTTSTATCTDRQLCNNNSNSYVYRQTALQQHNINSYVYRQTALQQLSRNLCCGPEPLGPVRTEFDVCLKSTLFN